VLLGACLLALTACAPAATPAAAGPAASRPAAQRPEPTLRVGLLVDTTSATLSSPTGFDLVDPADNRTLARVPAATTLTFTADSAGALRYSIAGTATRVSSPLVLARPTGTGMLEIGGRRYRGAALVRPGRPGRVTAINQVGMEDYLLGVVPREIGAIGDSLIEAAKAQAVAARTYAVKYVGRRADKGFDVYATVEDQVYGGAGDEVASISRAVTGTRGQIITFGGAPIEAYYHSTCAGRTVAIEDAWPNEAPRSYLVSVEDVNPATGQAYDTRSSRFRWTVRWPVDSLQRILSRTLPDSIRGATTAIGAIRDVRVLEPTAAGRVRALLVSTATGDYVIRGREIDMRRILVTPQGQPLNSTKFDVQMERGADGAPSAVVLTGGGWGHGIGMCQVGAMGRAAAGQDYRTILQAYFPTTQIQELY
jgi:stage II sporulation protein D